MKHLKIISKAKIKTRHFNYYFKLFIGNILRKQKIHRLPEQ